MTHNHVSKATSFDLGDTKTSTVGCLVSVQASLVHVPTDTAANILWVKKKNVGTLAAFNHYLGMELSQVITWRCPQQYEYKCAVQFLN